MVIVKSNLFNLLSDKERAEQRRITIEEIHSQTGVSRATVRRWMTKEPFRQLDMDVANVLMNYLGCTFRDLVLIEETDPIH